MLLVARTASGLENVSGSTTATVVPSPMIGLAGLEERIADPLQIVGRNADSGVGDAQQEARAVGLRKHSHLAAAFGELDGVRDEIDHDLLERTRIAGDDGKIGRRIDREIDAAFARLERKQVAAIDQCRAWRERLR